MRLSLFWKILLGIWATFGLITVGSSLAVLHFAQDASSLGEDVLRRVGNLQLASAASAYKQGGIDGLNALLADWPAENRAMISVVPAGQDIPAPQHPPVVRVVRVTDDGAFKLAYQTSWKDYGVVSLPQIPAFVLLTMILGSLAFSATLAWYMTRPIKTFRTGFERLAHGDLTVRLTGDMGRRRDELTDLSRDFDSMAEQLQALVNARQQLLHDVSHELRSPLTRILMAIGLARQDTSRGEASLSRIETEAVRLNELVSELLTLFRIEGRIPQREEYIDIASLVQAVAEDARFEAKAAGVVIVDRIVNTGNLTAVTGSAELLRRAIENVVRNALRFSKSDQTIAIEAAPDATSSFYIVTVADEGPGVAPEMLSSIFEPFFRADGTSGPGFGLGLAIAKRAVLAHGGTIVADNRPSGGLHVGIRLPLSVLTAAGETALAKP